MTEKLKPNLCQFKKSLEQMIEARNEFNIPVGFGTAIPFCLDERLITENMWADCGVGVTFGAVNPEGDFRICNQSPVVYGNILRESIEKIWNKRKIDDFRKLEWVTGPCKNCPFLHVCTCGCKVDLNCSKKYCVDYAVRNDNQEIVSLNRLKKLKDKFEERELSGDFPKEHRIFIVNRYARLNTKHKENYLVTRYQTICLDKLGIEIMKAIKQISGEIKEKEIVKKFNKKAKEEEIRSFISKLNGIEAIDIVD